MKFIKQSWGGYTVYEGDKFLGLVDKLGSKWETNDGQEHLSRQKAGEYLLSFLKKKEDVKSKLSSDWMTTTQIREVIGEKEFRLGIYNGKYTIIQADLGQPRMGEPIFGFRMFKLRQNVTK